MAFQTLINRKCYLRNRSVFSFVESVKPLVANRLNRCDINNSMLPTIF